MRDQCGVIFKQAKKELEAAGLLPVKQEVTEQPTSGGGGGGEETLSSDIDRELELLQVGQHFKLPDRI